jgi:hypothetical protein
MDEWSIFVAARLNTRNIVKLAFPVFSAISIPLAAGFFLTDINSQSHSVWEKLFLVNAIATAIAVVPFRKQWDREQRTKKGLCPQCGYDLRATPDRCPECGGVSAKIE